MREEVNLNVKGSGYMLMTFASMDGFRETIKTKKKKNKKKRQTQKTFSSCLYEMESKQMIFKMARKLQIF